MDEKLLQMNRLLLEDQPQYAASATQFPKDDAHQRQLMRSLMNVRLPKPIPTPLLNLQDEILQAERAAKGIVHVADLPRSQTDDRLILWQGDITRLDADAIVNAANSELLGCFVPCHGCIDNAIHSAAGLQLRERCAAIMRAQGGPEPTGRAKLTPAYNLPSRYVLHTVGPIIQGRVTPQDEALLASCYRACLQLAAEHSLRSVAFCCISTGEFRFPNARAAEIAVQTVRETLEALPALDTVVFNVFKDLDLALYQALL